MQINCRNVSWSLVMRTSESSTWILSIVLSIVNDATSGKNSHRMVYIFRERLAVVLIINRCSRRLFFYYFLCPSQYYLFLSLIGWTFLEAPICDLDPVWMVTRLSANRTSFFTISMLDCVQLVYRGSRFVTYSIIISKTNSITSIVARYTTVVFFFLRSVEHNSIMSLTNLSAWLKIFNIYRNRIWMMDIPFWARDRPHDRSPRS